MKIKTFVCNRTNEEGLKAIDNEINSFIINHDVKDIKITSIANNFGSGVIYAVIYNDK